MIEDKEIRHCINAIREKLKDKRLNRFYNSAVKAGYIKSLEILEKGIETIPEAKINNLQSIQARAIAVLAVDFLNGECTESVLLGVPIKDK